MKTPVQITFRGIEASPAIDDYIRRRTAKLETFSNRMTRCHVTVEAPHHRHKHGAPYRVRIEMSAPGADLVVGDRSAAETAHQDLYAAVDDAFDDASRVLRDHVQRHRHDGKPHEQHR
jgi:ribosomal subunit interface protein